jgi:hypothetical protein
MFYTDKQGRTRYMGGSGQKQSTAQVKAVETAPVRQKAGFFFKDELGRTRFAGGPGGGGGGSGASAGNALSKWFGNSKIVDKSGNPLVVYRGVSDAEMVGVKDGELVWKEPNGPKPSELEAGMYFFSPDKSVAAKYGTPVPYYLRALNPTRNESPIGNTPQNTDAIYRMRGKGEHISDAWEIAVINPSQAMQVADIVDYQPLNL